MTGLPHQPKNRQNKHTNAKESSVFPTVAWLCKLGLLYTMATKRGLQAPRQRYSWVVLCLWSSEGISGQRLQLGEARADEVACWPWGVHEEPAGACCTSFNFPVGLKMLTVQSCSTRAWISPRVICSPTPSCTDSKLWGSNHICPQPHQACPSCLTFPRGSGGKLRPRCFTKGASTHGLAPPFHLSPLCFYTSKTILCYPSAILLETFSHTNKF